VKSIMTIHHKISTEIEVDRRYSISTEIRN